MSEEKENQNKDLNPGELADILMDILDEVGDAVTYETAIAAFRICDLRISNQLFAMQIPKQCDEDCDNCELNHKHTYCEGCIYESLEDESLCSTCKDGSNKVTLNNN